MDLCEKGCSSLKWRLSLDDEIAIASMETKDSGNVHLYVNWSDGSFSLDIYRLLKGLVWTRKEALIALHLSLLMEEKKVLVR